jgi:hypothetical protein
VVVVVVVVVEEASPGKGARVGKGEFVKERKKISK